MFTFPCGPYMYTSHLNSLFFPVPSLSPFLHPSHTGDGTQSPTLPGKCSTPEIHSSPGHFSFWRLVQLQSPLQIGFQNLDLSFSLGVPFLVCSLSVLGVAGHCPTITWQLKSYVRRETAHQRPALFSEPEESKAQAITKPFSIHTILIHHLILN